MLKNYFKIAWRNIIKYPFYSLVNITGLFTGIAFTLLIGAYVWGELQMNKKLRNTNRQYLLKSEWKDSNLGQEITTLGPLSKRLKEDYPDLVANYYRWDGITSVVSKGEKHLRENIQLGDSTLLSMYGFELLYGDKTTALNNTYSVVITKDIAIKYFGKTDVVGQTVNIQNFSGGNHEFTITAVLNDIPENSVTQINADNINAFFIPANTYAFFGRSYFEAWTNQSLPSYIELKAGVSPKDLEKPIQQLIQQNTSDLVQRNLKVMPVALTDYYLEKNSSLVKRMLYTLSFVGLFILLMAIINFVNMAVSRSSSRMREIGIRKVLGGLRKQLIFQFLTESIILVFIATILAIAAYPLLQPLFNTMIGKEVGSLLSFPVSFVLIPLAAIVLVGLLAGLYPAFMLSSVKPVDSLKGKLKSVNQNIVLRKSLVGFQFAVALIVLIAATIVTQQVTHFFSQDLGYNKAYIVSSQVPRDWTPAGVQKMNTVRNEFAAMPQISSATLSYEIPNGNNGGQPSVYGLGADSTNAVAMQLLISDENYLNTYQIPLKAGSFFDNKGPDSAKVIMNEKAIAALGYNNANEAIGQQIRVPDDPTIFTIKGVTSDFHFGSMQQAIAPVMFFSVNAVPQYRFLSFKIRPGNVAADIEAIQKKWSTLLPGTSFEYTFMDDTLKKLYTSELQLKRASYTAAILALIITMLGVLGLVSLNMHKRIKEIGIRKVLGASLPNIIGLFVQEFTGVMIIAAAIACPVAYFIMKGWLNNYAYRINITILQFIWAIAGLGILTILLIVLQTIKAAFENPIKSLKTE